MVMVTCGGSQASNESANLGDVGRPRTRPPGEKTTLSFQVEDAFLKALDDEALRLTTERGPGARKVSRSEMVMIILSKWLTDHSKTRAKARD
jgi:hypothetical protein